MKEIRINIATALFFIFIFSTIAWIVGIYNHGDTQILAILYLTSIISGALFFIIAPPRTKEDWIRIEQKRKEKEEKARLKEEKRRQKEIENSPTAAGKPFS